jgi:hypothetical protein
MAIVFLGTDYEWMSLLSAFNLNILSSSGAGYCLAPVTPWEKLLTGIWVPFMSVGILGCMAGVHWLFWYCAFGRRKGSNVKYRRSICPIYHLFFVLGVAELTMKYGCE